MNVCFHVHQSVQCNRIVTIVAHDSENILQVIKFCRLLCMQEVIKVLIKRDQNETCLLVRI